MALVKDMKKKYSRIFSSIYKNQTGQTLIETVVAIFVLVMGIVAALGLAVYSLNASSNVSKQIVAIGLAREGVEAIKNMRDSNWLLTSLSSSCYDFSSGLSNSPCYINWLKGDSGAPGTKKGYDIDPGNGASAKKCFRIQLNPSASGDSWLIKEDNCSNANPNNNKWGLDLDSSFSGSSFAGVYGVGNLNNGVTHGSSDYYRKIVITKDSNPPYDKPNMYRVLVESQVWWVDKKCPRVTDYTPGMRCSIVLQTYLTNWKNY